jgi:hypothetical protein
LFPVVSHKEKRKFQREIRWQRKNDKTPRKRKIKPYKVRKMPNISKFFFLMIYIWLDRACKTVEENIFIKIFHWFIYKKIKILW